MKLFERFARTVDARKNCINSNNSDWQQKHEQTIYELINRLPHGSGIDHKTTIDLDKSGENRLIFYSSYHTMNENGYYDRWIDFSVKVTPSLMFGFNLSIFGNFGKYDYVKDYLYDIYNESLREEVE